ncbi:MAG TPA: glycosyltransferase family 2 protein [Thermoanaerobaculia bacterium]|nr:glycosyltransferase family 2 protein [Thermoanaerobaculia bacterium]
MRTDVVAVIPAYQCAESIGVVVEGCRRHLATVHVIDDGSRDSTAEAARAAGAKVTTRPQNQGKGVALAQGIELALAEEPAAVLLLDGDGQHDPADIPAFLAAWDQGRAELIVGSRMGESEKIPRVRYWTNHVGSLILSHMTGYELEDSQSGYRLLDARLLRSMHLRTRGYAIESEMLLKAAKLHARLVHVPIRTIYEGCPPSHFQPFMDTSRIVFASIRVQVFDEL